MAVSGLQRSIGNGLLVMLVFAAVGGAAAGIKEFQVERSNEDRTYLGSFAFTKEGHVNITVSHLVVYSPEKVSGPDTFSMGFFFIREFNASSSLLEKSSQCILTSPNVSKLFSLLDMQGPQSGGERPEFNFHANAPGEGSYSLYFANCEPSRLISADVKVELYNEGESGTRYYLPAGTEAFPFIHFTVAVVYLAMGILWLWHARKFWCQPVAAPRAFHVCLTLLLLSNLLLAVALGAQYTKIQISGASQFWSFIVNVVLCIHGALLLASFFTGILKVEPYASEFERGLLMLAVPILIAANVTFFLLPDISTTTVWRPCFAFFSSVLSIVIAFAWGILAILVLLAFLGWFCTFSWSVKGPRPGSFYDDRDVDNPFNRFYVLATMYIMAVLVLTYFLKQQLPFTLQWAAYLFQQLATLAFYAFVLLRFRPRTEKSVYQLFDETDSVDEELDNL